MSDIVLFEKGKAEYLKSVNTPDYEGNPNVLINPDLSGVSNVPLKYWKRLGDRVVEMPQKDKDTIDAGELKERKDKADSFSVSPLHIFTALIKVINSRLPSNKITKEELIDAIKEEVN